MRRTALVTGGGRGLGAATAQRLRADGVDVLTLDRSGDADIIVDLTDEAAFAVAAAEIGVIDILINAAGMIGPSAPLVETEASGWRTVFEVNVLGVVATMRAFVPGMTDRGWGRVVNFASMQGKDPSANLSIYAASKAAVIALTKASAKELATTGVLVNAIAPGVIASPMSDMTPPDVMADLIDMIPMKRMGSPEEVAELAAWLASEKVSFSTGFVYDISGGRATY